MKALPARLSQLLHGGAGLRVVVLLGIAGLGLILVSSLLPAEKAQPTAVDKVQSEATETDYNKVMEAELTRILQHLRGVGAVRVMITLENTGTQVYAEERTAEHSAQSSRAENRFVLVGGGAAQTALVESVAAPQISGVVIVCEGGDNSIVREQVVRAAAVACGVPSTNVFVGSFTE